MLTLIKKLRRTRLLTLPGLFRLVQAVLTTGINLMAMLRVAAKLHPQRIAVADDNERLTYLELWQQSEVLAGRLYAHHAVRARQKAAIICRSHAAAIKAIFAFSRLGTHVFLVNPEMVAEQLLALDERLKFDHYVYDEHLAHVFTTPALNQKSIPAYHPTDTSIERLATRAPETRVRLRKFKTGNIVVMTGGTTGQPKAASRKPSIVNFLPPFIALLTQVHLDNYRKVYVATPVYHGFGLAALLIGVVLGAEMHFTRRFDAAKACELIAKNQIELVTLVPVMLQRMLKQDLNLLASLKCIVSGGALLSPALAKESLERLGPTLFNLYGTSEAGFSIMSPPELLQRKPESIGKPVRGVEARIVNEADQIVGEGQVGRLCIRCAWATTRKNWTETGDMAYRDSEGDLFLCGRIDDMIVSGGENVYPIELENILLQHPEIDSVAVIGIPDADFGQRLKAVIVTKPGATLGHANLLDWLKPRAARYQMPAVIEFRDELPYTALGKLDKKALRA